MRKITAIICITFFCAVMIAISYKVGQPHQELLSPEAQLDDTLLLDHSRIPEDNENSHCLPDTMMVIISDSGFSFRGGWMPVGYPFYWVKGRWRMKLYLAPIDSSLETSTQIWGSLATDTSKIW